MIYSHFLSRKKLGVKSEMLKYFLKPEERKKKQKKSQNSNGEMLEWFPAL